MSTTSSDSEDDIDRFMKLQSQRIQSNSLNSSKTSYEKFMKLKNTVPAPRRTRGVETIGASRNHEEDHELREVSFGDSNSSSFVLPIDEVMEEATEQTEEGHGALQPLEEVGMSTSVHGTDSAEDKEGNQISDAMSFRDSTSPTFDSVAVHVEEDDEDGDAKAMEVTGNQTTDPNSSTSSGTDTFQPPTHRRSGRIQAARTPKDKKQTKKAAAMSSSESQSSSFETAEEDCEDREEKRKIRVYEEGDGTNNSLVMLTESDIKYIKENREDRQNTDAADTFVQCNPERYFTAGKRIKQKKTTVEAPNTPAGAKKIKKPRKGNRTGRTPGDNLPEKSTSTFSVSAEIAKLNLRDSPNSLEQPKHREEIDALQGDIVKDFPRWHYILRENFNILLYGYGSKEPILEEYKSFLNEEFLAFDIQGLFPKLNPRMFLLAFWKELELDDTLPPSGNNILAMAEDMQSILKDVDHPSVFLFVYNLEKLAFRFPKFLKALCCLSRIKFIHIIATVDHINSGLGIGHNALVDLNLFWINCTSFAPYEKELLWKESLFNDGQEEETSQSSLDQVLKSLTANSRKAFGILVSLQLKAMKTSGQSKQKNFEGIKFLDLLRKCREAFVAHGEMPLRTLLTEFLDHKLIRYAGKGKKTDNLLIVDFEVEKLEQIVNGL